MTLSHIATPCRVNGGQNMTILERLQIIEQLAESGDNLSDIKHHVAEIRKELGLDVKIGIPQECNTCNKDLRECFNCEVLDLFTPKTASHG